MSPGVQLILIFVWAFGGPATAYYWLDLPYGRWIACLWLAGLVFLVRWNLPKDLEDITN